MKTSIAGRIRTCGAIIWDLFLSATGCFVLRRYFCLVAEGGDGPEAKAPVFAIGQPTNDARRILLPSIVSLVKWGHRALCIQAACKGEYSQAMETK